MTTPKTLDDLAIGAKTYREVLVGLLDKDWNLRREVMHADDGVEFHAVYKFVIDLPMDLVKQALADLPPMA